jgi:hypothetical protein
MIIEANHKDGSHQCKDEYWRRQGEKKGEHAYNRSLSDDGTDRAYKTDAP